MTLQQIRYALTAAEQGSMNKAAEILYISQPTLTTAVRSLENEVGVRLFNRTNQGITMTAEGRDFLMQARQIYQQYELLKDKYASGQVRKKFKVSCQHYSLAAKAFVETVKKYGTGKFDFEISETRTMDVITDVGSAVSELGILFISDYNRRYLEKLFKERELTFTGLVTVQAFVCLYCGHPLAKNKSIGFDELAPYPNMSFDQGENASLFLNEEILADNEYPQTIKVNDRATMLNLLKGLNGYTFCPGVISEELHGSDYVAVPYRPDEDNPGRLMEIGYITRSRSILSDVALDYIIELKKCFSSGSAV